MGLNNCYVEHIDKYKLFTFTFPTIFLPILYGEAH